MAIELHILQIIDNLHPGGAERVMIDLCNGLHEAGVNVEVALIVGDGLDLLPQLHEEIKVHLLNRKGRLDFRSAFQMSRLLRLTDIAHVHMRHNYRYVSLVSRLFSTKTCLVFQDHYGKINLDQSVPWGFRTLFFPEYYIGVSKILTSWAKEYLNIPEERIFLLENIINPISQNQNFKKHGLVLVSNLKPQKNQLFALELLKGTSWTIDIYGSKQDESYAHLLSQEIESRKLLSRVQLIHNCTNIQNVLAEYRLGIHTSTSETGPLTIIEYLAQGLPFLAYKTGEAAEKISQDFPEFFIDTFEVEDWVERIEQLMTSPPDLEKMAHVFEKHFNKKAYLEKCLKIYDSALHS